MGRYLVTNPYGNTHDTVFNDLEQLKWNGEYTLDFRHPHKQIKIVSDGYSVVHGIDITYRITTPGSKEATFRHGSRIVSGLSETVIDFKPTERITSVFGRVGKHMLVDHAWILSIGFTIFDTSTLHSRVVGPIGSKTEGITYHSYNVGAFGGYERPGENTFGLSGLFFLEKHSATASPDKAPR